jgi:hypothetical protein
LKRREYIILISLTDGRGVTFGRWKPGRGVTSGRFSIWKIEVSLGAMLVLSSPESLVAAVREGIP